MSKIETMKSLPTPADLRRSVSQIQQALDDSSHRLDSTARQVRDLEQLPQLVAEQVSEALKALDPILSLSQKVQNALEAFDRVNQVQRQTLESLAQELSNRAAQAMEQKTASLTTALKSVTENTTELFRGLEVSMDLMSEAVSDVRKLPSRLAVDLSSSVTNLKLQATDLKLQATALQEAGNALKVETDRARARPRWKVLGELLAVATVAALLVGAGQAALNRILPSSETQQSAAWATNVWANATPAERQLLKQIVSRPAK